MCYNVEKVKKEKKANSMTSEQVERFIQMQAEGGKIPLETITALLRLIGAESVPEFKKADE